MLKRDKSFVIDLTADARFISYKDRKNADSDSYVDSKRRSFPILKPGDVKAAVHAWGRYKGSMSFNEFKKRLTEIAHKKGFQSELPAEWTKDGK